MIFWKKKNKEESDPYKTLIIGAENDNAGRIRVSAIINYLNDGILVFDEKNQLSLINAQAEKFLEVKKEEVLGQSILKLNPFLNFRPLVSILGGDVREVFRKDIQLKENLILEVTTIPMIVHGAKIGAIIVLRDVTREKMVESMKSEFVTVAAHQLRTPTSGIKWSLGMLKEGDLGPLSKEQKEVIGKAYNSNEKVIHLIADLLNVARIEGGKYLNKITLSSVEDLIQSLVAEYEDEMKRRELNFGFKKPKEKLPNIMMDVDKMGIAVGNLIDNAMRYTIAGGKISIYIAKKDEDQIEVQVHDTGLGIPQNQKDKVFTKFFRGDNITKVETEGTGLGLFITKNIIDAHGGKIWFESEKDKGTTFYFTIPIKEKFAEFITPELY